MALVDRARLEMKYLERQTTPVWGGHLKRGEPPNPILAAYIEDGLIAVANSGYQITERGRQYARGEIVIDKYRDDGGEPKREAVMQELVDQAQELDMGY